jgi:hypothetical protein
MKATLRDGVVLTGVKKIVVYREYGRIKFDNYSRADCTPVVIEAEAAEEAAEKENNERA